MNNSERHGEVVHHHHSHHHHSHEQHCDTSEIFKQKSLLSIKRRRQIGRVLFVVLSIVALAIIFACIASSYIE